MDNQKANVILESIPTANKNQVEYIMSDKNITFYKFLMDMIKYCAEVGKEVDVEDDGSILDGIKYYLETNAGF